MKACDYCSETPTPMVGRQERDEWSVALSAFSGELVCEIGECLCEFEVNFCPMCGRKLVEEPSEEEMFLTIFTPFQQKVRKAFGEDVSYEMESNMPEEGHTFAIRHTVWLDEMTDENGADFSEYAGEFIKESLRGDRCFCVYFKEYDSISQTPLEGILEHLESLPEEEAQHALSNLFKEGETGSSE